MSESAINYIVTHGNKAHRDDIIAIAIAAYLTNVDLIYRRKPTESELNDNRVMVIDTGGLFQPKMNNFDHHQDANLSSAAHLVANHFGVSDAVRDVFSGFDTIDVMDRLGPYKTAKELGMTFGQIQLLNDPLAEALCDVVSKIEVIEGQTLCIIKKIGEAIVTKAKKYQNDMKILEEVEICVAAGVKYCAIRDADNIAMFDFARKHDIAIMITPDRDSKNLRLRHINEHPSINLKKLQVGRNGVISITNSGHFAVVEDSIAIPPLIFSVKSSTVSKAL